MTSRLALPVAALAIALAVPAARGAEAQLDTATPRNSPQAIADLCRMARRGDTESQYQLAWIFAHGRGAERRDDWASYLFFAASTQGHSDARRMLQSVTWPAAAVPDCFSRATAAMPALVPATQGVSAPPHIERLVRQLAPQFQIKPQFVLAIIAVESNFDVAALSPKNAQGLMQLIPQTARRFGVRNAFDAQQNIRGGMAYLRWLMAYFEGDVRLVSAAYNAGERAVERYLGVPPYAETRMYVLKIRAAAGGQTTHRYDPAVTRSTPVLAGMLNRGTALR